MEVLSNKRCEDETFKAIRNVSRTSTIQSKVSWPADEQVAEVRNNTEETSLHKRAIQFA